jgi:hypothetical protein
MKIGSNSAVSICACDTRPLPAIACRAAPVHSGPGSVRGFGHGYFTRFLGNYHNQGITLLREPQRGAMARAKGGIQLAILTQRQQAFGGNNQIVANNDGAIVEGRPGIENGNE